MLQQMSGGCACCGIHYECNADPLAAKIQEYAEHAACHTKRQDLG